MGLTHLLVPAIHTISHQHPIWTHTDTGTRNTRISTLDTHNPLDRIRPQTRLIVTHMGIKDILRRGQRGQRGQVKHKTIRISNLYKKIQKNTTTVQKGCPPCPLLRMFLKVLVFFNISISRLRDQGHSEKGAEGAEGAGKTQNYSDFQYI